MRRTRLGLLALALMLLAALPATASAGGWLVIVLDKLPADVAAGQEFTIGFTALQHGQTPLAGLEKPPIGNPPAYVKLVQPGSGTIHRVPVQAEGPAGHYTAKLSFPTAGTWEWAIVAWGEHPMPALAVQPAASRTASGRPATAAFEPPPGFWAVVGGAAALVSAAAVAGLILSPRWRRRATDAG
jgi:hypothetical protein